MTDTTIESMLFEEFEIEIIRSRRRKTLSLEVSSTGVKARAPERMRDATIRKFIQSKYNWIVRHLENLPRPMEPLRLVDGCELNLLGQTYQLRTAKGRKAVYIADEWEIVVPIVNSGLAPEESVRRKLTKWYKEVAMRHLQVRVANHAASMLSSRTSNDAADPKIKVRDYKRRWGSCNHRGDLSFNWRIIMAPESVMEYVVIHELAHLREFNHSARFWRIVEQQMPGWREQQQWLADNGVMLYRF